MQNYHCKGKYHFFTIKSKYCTEMTPQNTCNVLVFMICDRLEDINIDQMCTVDERIDWNQLLYYSECKSRTEFIARGFDGFYPKRVFSLGTGQCTIISTKLS